MMLFERVQICVHSIRPSPMMLMPFLFQVSVWERKCPDLDQDNKYLLLCQLPDIYVHM